MYLGRLILQAFHYQKFKRTFFPAAVVPIRDVAPTFLFAPIWQTFWPGVVATLLLVPVTALSLTIEMGDSYRSGILIALVVLGCLLIHYFGVLIEAESKTNV